MLSPSPCPRQCSLSWRTLPPAVARAMVLGSPIAADLAGAEAERLMLETSWQGVFAAGDVRSGSIKRVASAVGEGAMAVRMAHERARAALG
jgi:NADPH-dependent glutamate synthase beta subunit-like oxidoreductase